MKYFKLVDQTEYWEKGKNLGDTTMSTIFCVKCNCFNLVIGVNKFTTVIYCPECKVEEELD